ncbi:MAG: DUF2141 domain-containing protein [Lewinella sp.]
MFSIIVSYLIPLLTASAPQTLNVQVVAPTSEGRIFVAAYDSPKGFDQEDNIAHAIHPLREKNREVEVSLEVPARGEYVLAAFQDLNGNGKLDTNFFGVPTEPYGFAKIPPTKWRSPDFGEIATEVTGSEEFRIELRAWADY